MYEREPMLYNKDVYMMVAAHKQVVDNGTVSWLLPSGTTTPSFCSCVEEWKYFILQRT